MKKIILSVLFSILMGVGSISACTSAVISAKASKNGRPMLWKNRDTYALNNKIMIFNDGKYPYVALVNSSDKKDAAFG